MMKAFFEQVNPPSQAELDYLGLRLFAEHREIPSREIIDLEQTIFKLCRYLDSHHNEGRLASVLLSWMKIHGDRVFVDKLKKLQIQSIETTGAESAWLRLFAYFNVSLNRHNWRPLTTSHTKRMRGEKHYLVSPDPQFGERLIKRWGLEPYLPHNSDLKIHKGGLRNRSFDVMDPSELAARNTQYRNRLRYGANVRSDVATYLDHGTFPTPTALSEFLNMSREAVRRHWQDLKLASSAESSHHE